MSAPLHRQAALGLRAAAAIAVSLPAALGAPVPAPDGLAILAVLRDLAAAWGLDLYAAVRDLPPESRAIIEARLPLLPPPTPPASPWSST